MCCRSCSPATSKYLRTVAGNLSRQSRTGCLVAICAPRFLFFITGSNRILGGTQDTLQVLTEAGEADMGDEFRHITDIIDEASMKVLRSAAEAAFHKGDGRLMKFVQVTPCAELPLSESTTLYVRRSSCLHAHNMIDPIRLPVAARSPSTTSVARTQAVRGLCQTVRSWWRRVCK